jgi:hypothetical protein
MVFITLPSVCWEALLSTAAQKPSGPVVIVVARLTITLKSRSRASFFSHQRRFGVTTRNMMPTKSKKGQTEGRGSEISRLHDRDPQGRLALTTSF